MPIYEYRHTEGQGPDCETEFEEFQSMAADALTECPKCGKLGRYQGLRERELIGRRGPVPISEPEYFCPCCRKAFFPEYASDRR